MNYRMAHIYLDTDSSHRNFQLRTPADVLRVLDDDRLIHGYPMSRNVREVRP